MISIIDKSLCCGCGACEQTCPQKCIHMGADNEGFAYPYIDINNCIDCGRCERACPCLNQGIPHRPINVYAAINSNDEVRIQSSSGGIFTLLAEQIIEEGGVVFGARFNDSWQVIHDYTETKDCLAAFRGSKYVQSEIGNTYKFAESFLRQGRRVMFTGTPCQIAGLKRYLHKEYNNLLAVDFVCHGTPSPLIWHIYLREIIKTEIPPSITDISFRDKTFGWKKYSFKIQSSHKTTLIQPYSTNLYMKAFLEDITLRPSCYNCPVKSGKSESDITIGDFWGIDKIAKGIDDNKGCSLVIPHSNKGIKLCTTYNKLHQFEYTNALTYNPSIEQAARIPNNREYFFYILNNTQSLSEAYQKYHDNSLFKRIERKLYKLIKA